MANKVCALISKEDNDQIFALLGAQCQTLSTTVVQLFVTEPPLHSKWIKTDTGILCFIKDNHKKTYFFRLYCLKRNKMVWQQEIYRNMEYDSSCRFLHTFEGEGCMVAFNFANVQEAQELKVIVNRNLLSKAKMEKKKKTANITPADIQNPSGFRHVSHVGFDPDEGFVVNSSDLQLPTILGTIELFQHAINAQPNQREISEDEMFDEPYNSINRSILQRSPPELPPRTTSAQHVIPKSNEVGAATTTMTALGLQDIEQEFEFKPRSICAICYDKTATYLVVPCGHKIYCDSCAQIQQKAKAERCPICNGQHMMAIMVRE